MAFSCRNSDALFVPERQSFLDNVMACLQSDESRNDPAEYRSRPFFDDQVIETDHNAHHCRRSSRANSVYKRWNAEVRILAPQPASHCLYSSFMICAKIPANTARMQESAMT
jgi:hypothetical protein